MLRFLIRILSFFRLYARSVRNRPPIGHPLYASVRNGLAMRHFKQTIAVVGPF